MREFIWKFIKIIIYIVKAITATVISMLILSVFCFFFYKTPKGIATPGGATDFVYPSHFKYRNSSEGFGYGETNNEGYINVEDYFENQTNVDILVMGPSNFEGLQVPINKVMAIQLNEMLPNKNIYNLGLSGQYFQNCVQNLSSALKKYNPEYVIIGTNSLEFSEDAINFAFENNYTEQMPSSNKRRGLIQSLRMKVRENPFVSRTIAQLKVLYTNTLPSSDNTIADKNSVDRLLKYVSQIAKSYDVKPIVLFHPKTSIDIDGSPKFSTSESQELEFSQLCKKNGIVFLSMRSKFREEYITNHILPTGFISTSFGRGHINIDGHRMMAEEVCELFNNMKN